MSIELATTGIKVKWAVESTAGTRPTTGFAAIRGIKSIPEFGDAPNTLDVTPLSETSYHRYIPGLRDSGGAIGLTVNDYDDFRTDWDSMMSAYATAAASDKALWIEYEVPGLTTDGSFFYTAVPVELGFGGAEVDSVLENTAYLMPNTVEGWGTTTS